MNSLFFMSYIFKKLYGLFTPSDTPSPYYIQILYQNPNMILINKQPDLKINSNHPHEITVQTLLRDLLPSLVNPNLGHEFYFPQRLDYSTSGVMVIALRKDAARIIADAFALRKVKKYYIAVVRGLMSSEYLDIDVPIGEDRRRGRKHMMVVESRNCLIPRHARTLFLVLEEGMYDNYPATKILVRPITGRRHQIRLHLNYLGHTIVGDFTYSERRDLEPTRMLLHSHRMSLILVGKTFDVGTPDTFADDEKWMTTKVRNKLCEKTYEFLESCITQL